MARRKKRRRSRKPTFPIAPMVGLAAGLVRPLSTAMAGNYGAAFGQLVHNYTGVEGVEHGAVKFNAAHLKAGLLPLVVGLLVHKFVGGPPLNLNKMLGAANVPYLRI